MCKKDCCVEQCKKCCEAFEELKEEFGGWIVILIEMVAKDRGMKLYEVMDYVDKEYKKGAII